jgi:hypothetical protein
MGLSEEQLLPEEYNLVPQLYFQDENQTHMPELFSMVSRIM